MVEGELNEYLDELEWWALLSRRIFKEVTGSIIDNGEVWGKFLAGDPVEAAEFKIKVSTWI